MTFEPATRRAAIAGALALVGALYLADLTGMGMVTPDEPRYAAIGREMARSGDWITPRLWGEPWFEKPALLYWMTASGFRAGLGADLAPRLPVALLSLAFLGFFWWRVHAEWGRRVAWYSGMMLATCGGWLAYSHVAVTDLPLAAFFSAAALLSLPWIARGDRGWLTLAAASLGLATMAKQLVPLVLFLPVWAMGWRRLRDWVRPAPLLAFAVCALPWYILCTLRNGAQVPRVLFLEQAVSRFGSPALQHVQPWWFYVPVILILLYPWFPLLTLVRVRDDRRIQALAAVTVFGLVFFSASVNKLPGYLLPLIPPLCILMGIGLAQTKRPALAMVGPIALTGLLPFLAGILPGMLARGFRSVPVPWGDGGAWLAAAGFAGLVIAFVLPRAAVMLAGLLAATGLLWFQIAASPTLDAADSARPLWLASQPACAPVLTRGMLYGLNYYAQKRLPLCSVLDPKTTRSVR